MPDRARRYHPLAIGDSAIALEWPYRRRAHVTTSIIIIAAAAALPQLKKERSLAYFAIYINYGHTSRASGDASGGYLPDVTCYTQGGCIAYLCSKLQA